MKTIKDIFSSESKQAAMETEYGEEIMSAGWNPAVEIVSKLQSGSQTEATLGTPSTYTTMK